MKRNFGPKFEKLLTRLRNEYPVAGTRVIATTADVLKRRWPPDGAQGDCTRGAVCTIRIRETIPENQAAELLCHEWAHARTKIYMTKTSHTDEWGAAYAQCYRVMEEVFEWV